MAVHHFLSSNYNCSRNNNRRHSSTSCNSLRLHKGSLKSRARQFLVLQVGNDGLRDKAFSMHNPRLSLVVSAGVG